MLKCSARITDGKGKKCCTSAATESIRHLFGSRAWRSAFSTSKVGPAAEKRRWGSLNAPPMVRSREWPSLMSREPPGLRGDALGLERHITEPVQAHEAAPRCFWGGGDGSPVQCMCVFPSPGPLCPCPSRVM